MANNELSLNEKQSLLVLSYGAVRNYVSPAGQFRTMQDTIE
jgi:hypothetical protein